MREKGQFGLINSVIFQSFSCIFVGILGGC